MVADLGSSDNTLKICEDAGVEIYKMKCHRNEARNRLIDNTSGVTFLLEPWETFIKGADNLNRLSTTSYATILQNNMLTKDIRAWTDKPRFVNPVYETIEQNAVDADILIYSTGRNDHEDILLAINEWKKSFPIAIAPYYYEACTLLSMGKWQQFLTASEYYMFLDKTLSMPAIMNHYYFAMVQLMNLKKVRPSLQNLSICLSAKPLMAEFWCLAGDVHYHLTKKFNVAKDLYENAIFLGGKRLKNDNCPMDLAKYKTYPNKMIDSCDKIMQSKSVYIST